MNTGACGDGLRQSNGRDDGNNEEGDCAIQTAQPSRALVVITDPVERNCDDANTVDGDYCSADCQTITGACGDDIIQPNEACDDGNTDEDDYCQSDCMAITGTCGDGILKPMKCV